MKHSPIFASVVCTALAIGALAPNSLAQDKPPPPPTPLPGLDYTEPFFPGAHYDNRVPEPSAILGFPVGSKPATHAQIEAVVKAIAAASPRTRLVEYGRTHEGRTLYYVVIASEPNLGRLGDLKADYAKLADPRKVPREEGDRLAATLPALAWMAYVIHGDEMSGSDASLAALHHLAAGTDPDVASLLENEVVIIDPLMNPDGRDRYLSMLAQNRTVQPSVDDQSLLHSGFWPSGRMNHYLFDMNRDWIFATQPETRGRIRAINEWHPHYFMESHEMGSQDTFLFMPGREALNPNLPENIKKWEVRFANDQAAAFDARGWRYYTGEWNDNWYPGYSSSWAALRGAVENLYEQAAISTDAVRRPEGGGALHPYREAVHKQLVSTMANLTTLARNRREVLTDFLAHQRACVGQPPAAPPERTFAVLPSKNPTRLRAFLDLMTIEGFEVLAADQDFSALGRDRLGRAVNRAFPAGTLLIPSRQPLAALLLAMLEFDPRMTPAFLTDERRELLRFGRSRIYDITGWSIPMLLDVEAFELEGPLPAEADARPAPPPAPPPAPAERVTNADTTVAFVIDGDDDASIAAAGRLMERAVWVRIADKPFQFDGKSFARGSVLITRKDNTEFPGDLLPVLREVCTETGASAIGIRSGMGPGDLPDLGGEHFVLLHPPRIAILGREPVSPYSYGEAWYTIDRTLGLRASYLDAQSLGGADLRRYNVLVIPHGANSILKERIDDLKAWASAGGTIIAIGSSAGAFAKEKDGIGSTRVLPDVLTKLDPYRQAVVREWEGRTTAPVPEQVWSATPPPESEVVYPWLIGESDDKGSEDELKRKDSWRQIFMPAGTLLAGRVDDRSWLTAGCGEYVPLMFFGDTVLLAPPSVAAPVRLGVFSPGTCPLPDEAAEPPPPEPPKPETKAKDKEGAPADEKKPDRDADKDDKEETKKKPPPGWTIAPPGYELRLRMSGLLWPEAASRLANAAWVTREPVGSGQIILFASSPTYRAAALGTTRIFSNAVVCGPGMGATQPIKP